MYVLRRTLITAAALLFTGCASSETVPDHLERDFRCTVNVTGERNYSAELELVDNSGWNVKLTSPVSAEGIELSYLSDGNRTLVVQGHTIVYTQKDIPDTGVFDLITSAADMCIENKGVTVENSGSSTVSKGEIRGMNFAAHAEKGSLTSIEIGGRIKAEFGYVPAKAVNNGSEE